MVGIAHVDGPHPGIEMRKEQDAPLVSA